MAFDRKMLAVGTAHANTDIPRLFMYKTDDLVADLAGAGYFNEVADLLEIGDVIFAYTGELTVTPFIINNKAPNAIGVGGSGSAL